MFDDEGERLAQMYGGREAALEILESQIDRYGKSEQGIESLRDLERERADDFFGPDKKFRWWNGELYPVFGKYARKHSLQEIDRKEPGYLKWILTQNFSVEVKKMIQGVLEGRYPTSGRR